VFFLIVRPQLRQIYALKAIFAMVRAIDLADDKT
jgi:hypothetical protein